MRKALLLALCVVSISSLAFAGDPPARVARLSYMTGQVSIQPDGAQDWVAADINRPLTSSDRVWTDTDGRAELQLGSASLRLDNSTSLTLVNVSDNNVQLQLDQGTASLHVADLFDGEVYEVDTPNISFIVRKRGDYRFDVDNAGDTTSVTVFRGEGDVTGDGPAVRASKGERYTFTEGRSLRATMNHNPGLDGFDQWAAARAEREDKAEAARYVSRGAVGYYDLDDYGGWESVPTYGSIWFPRAVAVDWAPYRWGHWVWVGPWGWTWVDDAPWGFAPYHYGRWVYYRSRWGWCPGPIHVRPVYAPALVGWVGGSNWGVGLSFGVGGGVGWFPLGWGEPYIPYYSHSRGYFQHVNVSNTHITNITYVTNNYYRQRGQSWNYAYGHHSYAVTAVSNDNFRLSHPTRNNFVHVNDGELRNVSFNRHVPVRPTTNSMLGPHAGEHRSAPPTWTRSGGPDRRPGGPERHTVADAENPRPDRIARPDHDNDHGRPNVDNARDNGRPNRSFPRPPERGSPAVTADNERPHDVPNGNHGRTEGPSNTNNVAGRVPRPPDHSDRPGRQDGPRNDGPRRDGASPVAEGPRPNTGGDSSAHGAAPERNVPHPPENQAGRPERNNNPVGRIDRGPERNVPRPEMQPGRPQENRNQGVTHDMRPQTPAPRPAAPAPRAEQPRPAPAPRVEQPRPAPAPRVEQSRPAPSAPVNRPAPAAPQNKPGVERKLDRLNNQPGHAAVNYPRPYGTVREASYGSSYSQRMSYSDYERSYQPRSFSSNNTSATRPASRSYSSYSQSSYSQRAQSYSSPSRTSSYSASSHYSQPAARSYSQPSHSYSQPSRSYSQPSSSSSHSYSNSGGGGRSSGGGGGSSHHGRGR